MKKLTSLSILGALLAAVLVLAAQEKAEIQMDQSASFKPGGPITFNLTLNEPLPKGARFDLRVSPTSVDEEIALGGGQPTDDTGRHFRVSGALPEGALPGEWHVKIIWLFLPGSGWTQNTIATNNPKFRVEGKPYAIPTKAEIVVGH